MDNTEIKRDESNCENYCKENGKSIKKAKNKNFILKKKEALICQVCETENNANSNYCKSCGSTLSEITQTSYSYEGEKNTSYVKNISSSMNIKKVLLTSFSSILILFLMSLIFKGAMSTSFEEFGSLINPVHIMLGLNLGYVDITSSNLLNSGYMSAHLGIIILLVLPIISIGTSNILFMRKENKSSKSSLINALGVGFVYAMILGVLSSFSKIGTNSQELFRYGMMMEANYTFSSIFINGFIIAFLTTYLIGFKKKYESESMTLTILKKSIKTIFIGVLVVFLVLIAVTLSDSSYLYELGMYGYVNDLSIGLIVSQLAVYMWGFANFVPLVISTNTVSIFNLLSSDLFLDTKLIFIIMITISSLVILVNGCNLKRKYKSGNIKVVLMFSLFYALIMGALALFSSIFIGGNVSLLDMNSYQGNIMLGLPVLTTIIRAFLYSFIVSWLGYKLYVFE